MNDFFYAKEDEEYNQIEKVLLARPRLPSSSRKIVYRKKLADSSRIVLVETRKNSVFK